MFCPKCGDELVEVEGELTCVRGNMKLSQNLAARLTECYVDGVSTPREQTFSFGIGGEWFCPGCGTQAREKPRGVIRCAECERSLNEFLHDLTEKHPHERR
jgi:hypothetical protein